MTENGENGIRLEVTGMKIALDFDVKAGDFGPLVQANRARKAMGELRSWGDEPLTNDAAGAILDDFIVAAVTLRHVYDWTKDAAVEVGKKHLVDDLNRKHAAKVVAEICNGSKHKGVGPEHEKFPGPVRITAAGEAGVDTCRDYLESMQVRSPQATWSALELLDEVYEVWVELLKEELDLPTDWALQDGRAEALTRQLADGVERRLSLDPHGVLDVELDVQANGRPTGKVGRVPIPVPETLDAAGVGEMVFRIFRNQHESGKLPDEHYALALDNLHSALRGIRGEPGVGKMVSKVEDELSGLDLAER